MSILRRFWPSIIILSFSLVGIKALIHSGWYTSHDGEHQLVRQYIFDKSIKAGHIPPRIDRQLLNGLGYPLFTFTYQLPFIFGEPFRLLGLSTQDTVKIVFILAYLASGLTMYLFASELWGKHAGVLASLLYLWAPFHFSVIFVRASLGEHVALIFIPSLLWSVNNKFITQKRLIIGAISLACLLLSHLMVAQIFAPLIIFYALVNLAASTSKKKLLLHLLFITLTGIALSSYYLLPAFVHRSAILGLNRHFYSDHYPTFKQILYSRWDYGFSQVGTENDGMSFQLGFAHWLVILVSLVIFLTKSRANAVFLLSFIFAIFMSLSISTNFWDYLIRNYHWYIIDIPWRWLALATFTSAALGGFIYSYLHGILKILVILGTLFLMLYGNRNHLRVNKYIDYPDQTLSQYTGTSTSYNEYQSSYAKESMITNPNLPLAGFVSGTGQINISSSSSHRLTFTAQIDTPSQIQINTVYFPGWTLIVDNQIQNIQSLLTEGVPRINLSLGKHQVELTYKQTPVMKFGNILSLFTAGLILFIMIKPKLYAQKA